MINERLTYHVEIGNLLLENKLRRVHNIRRLLEHDEISDDTMDTSFDLVQQLFLSTIENICS